MAGNAAAILFEINGTDIIIVASMNNKGAFGWATENIKGKL
jgi:hypothetical protein